VGQRGTGRQAGPGDERVDRLVVLLGQQRLADPGAVQPERLAHPGRHPVRLGAVQAGDVDRLVAVEQADVHRAAGLRDEIGQYRPGDRRQVDVGERVARQPQCLRAGMVRTVLGLGHEVVLDQ
jgi:hypothetical protein